MRLKMYVQTELLGWGMVLAYLFFPLPVTRQTAVFTLLIETWTL